MRVAHKFPRGTVPLPRPLLCFSLATFVPTLVAPLIASSAYNDHCGCIVYHHRSRFRFLRNGVTAFVFVSFYLYGPFRLLATPRNRRTKFKDQPSRRRMGAVASTTNNGQRTKQ